MSSSIILIAHDIRSCHNVGSLLRTAEGLGIEMVYLTGYTPYPIVQNDHRLPHLAQRIDKQISKTALGAEVSQAWKHEPDIIAVLRQVKDKKFRVVALEQDEKSIPLPRYRPNGNIALLIGREVEGIDLTLLMQADDIIEIPMFGKKESFNVVQAAAMALYHIKFNGN